MTTYITKKRARFNDGAVNLLLYRDNGYLPDAMVNYLARLGWSHGDDEIFSRDELRAWVSFAHTARAAPL